MLLNDLKIIAMLLMYNSNMISFNSWIKRHESAAHWAKSSSDNIVTQWSYQFYAACLKS